MEKEKKSGITTRIIVEIALFAGIGLALDFLQGGLWRGVFTNGGSIGLSILPILIIAYRRGFLPALITGLIISLLQMLGGIYVISNSVLNVILQISLDYIITFPLVAFAGLFHKAFVNAKDKKQRIAFIIIGTSIGGLLKFLSHFLSGIIFWKNFEFVGGYVTYSLVYNGAYMLPNIIISIILLIILYIKVPQIFLLEAKDETK